MADFSALKTAIQTYIKQNGNEEITGEILQEILLSVVTTLGDTAINNLVIALADEVAARQNADGTLQQNITNEATVRGNADTVLSNRLGSSITAEHPAAEQISEEAEAREAADTALQGLIDGITDNIENGYVYAGIATPSSTPTTGKVFYLALTAGTYTNYGNTVVSQGINILKYNGSAWSLDAFIGIDDAPTPNSPKLVKSGGSFDSIMTDGSAFDISAHFASGGTLATYADLNAALAALDTLSASYKRGGMSIKFVQSSDNKYVQYRLKALTFTTDVEEWQEIVSEDYTKAKTGTDNSDLDLTDNGDNVLARFYDGHLRTKNFDSKTVSEQIDEQENAIIEISDKMENVPATTGGDEDLEISDENNNILAQFRNGGVRTKNFNSENVLQRQDLLMEPIMMYAYGEGGDATPDDTTHFYGWKNGKCAWQRAIDAADGITPTLIYCKGNIHVTDASQFTQQEDTLYNVVFIPSTKSNIQLIGESPEKTSLVVEMPDDFGTSNIETHQPMGIYGNNIVVKNMTITGKNCRYCIHVDATAHNIGDADNHNITFENMVLRHYENVSQSFNTAFAGCASDGMILTAKRCKFIQEDTYTACLYTHDNKDYEGGGILRFIDCTIENSKTNGVPIALFQMLGSGTENVIEFQNMDFGSNLPIIYCENNNSQNKPIDKFVANNHFSIKGCVDSPIGYLTRDSKSRVLRITSKSTGSNSKVRFDRTSSAFDVLIKGNYNTDYTENTGIVHIDGYHYRDGVDILKGYAMGEIALDINTDASIQKRLGDCSSSNKDLVISVDDVDYTITFNADYTNYSDADMLAVFTAVLGSVADVELYNWGADYFPELNSNVMWRRNSSEEAILVGMGVRERASQISKAVADDAIHGIALDDIPPHCYGRVAKKAYLSIYEDARHHICLETYPVRNTSDFYGYRGFFGIGTTPGVFVVKQTETPVYGYDKGGIDHYLAINK